MKCYNRACGTDLILFGMKIPLWQLIPQEVLEVYWGEEENRKLIGEDDDNDDLFDLNKCYLIGICPECGFTMTGTYKEEDEQDQDLKSITMVHLEGVE